MGPKLESWLQDGPQRMQQTLPPHKKPGYRKMRHHNVKDFVYKPPVDLWNVNMMFDTAGKFINHPANLPHYPPKYILKYKKPLLLTKPPFFSLLCTGTLVEKGTPCYGVCTFPSSSKGLPYIPLIDHHSSHITR